MLHCFSDSILFFLQNVKRRVEKRKDPISLLASYSSQTERELAAHVLGAVSNVDRYNRPWGIYSPKQSWLVSNVRRQFFYGPSS
jgi:hypothetical protein